MQIVFDATALNFWGELNPALLTTPGRMVGGTEANMMYLARSLAELGNEVIFFRQAEESTHEVFDNVHYMSHHGMMGYITDPDNEIDVIITANTGFRQIYGVQEIAAKLKVDYVSCTTLYATPEHINNTDIFICLSPWQRDKLINQGIPENKLKIVSMGYNEKWYNEPVKYEDRQNCIVYTSSPDRGLHHFLEIFKLLREQDDTITAKVYYNVLEWINRFKYDMNDQGYRVNQVLKNINLPGVQVYGGTCHKEVVESVRKAKALVYPCDCIEPGETQIISVLEAMAAGTPCILSNHDCIPSLYDGAAIIKDNFDYKDWAYNIYTTINNRDAWLKCYWKSMEYADGLSWSSVGKKFVNVVKSCI